MEFTPAEIAQQQHARQLGYLGIGARMPAGQLNMYNRGTQQTLTHSAQILSVRYSGLRATLADQTTQLDNNWRSLASGLRDGGKLTLTLHLPDGQPATLFRKALLEAMIDQTLERFRLVPADAARMGASGLDFWAFAYVAGDLGLSARPTTVADLVISGEVALLPATPL